MADRAIKPDSGNQLVLQDEGGSAALTIDTAGDTTVSGDLNPASGPANFVGMIAPFGKSSGTIDGWLYCDGSTLNSVSNTEYANLFSVIGTTWGGSSASSFKVPDLEGAFLRGSGEHGSSTMADGNAFTGQSVGSFENDQSQDHYHHLNYKNGASNASFVNNYMAKDDNAGNTLGHTSPTNTNTVVVTAPKENNSKGTPRVGDETRPFNAGVRYYIKF
jgi:microcystin-dependent protein